MSAQTQMANTRDFRSLELFTGAGGLALGTHHAGFDHVALIDWNREACDTLVANSSRRTIPGIESWQILDTDTRQVRFSDFDAVDLIAGGPPCQPFSIGGKHRGMSDTRDMIPEFVRAIRELTPRAFILENVRGLLRQSFRTYFAYVLFQLRYPAITRRIDEPWHDHLKRLEDAETSGACSDLHYNVVFRLLNAANYGVPQARERVFLVGFRSDISAEWHFPDETHSLDALLHEQWVTRNYWERHGAQAPPERPHRSGGRGLTVLKPTLLPLQPWRTVRDAINDLPEPFIDRDDSDGIYNHRLRPGARSYVGHTGSPLDLPAKTLKAGDHGVPGGENMIAFPGGSVRYFTVREAARLQTFPDAWQVQGAWSAAMRQLGNAVPVELAHVLAKSISQALRAHRS